MSNQACIIALKYEEPEYRETLECLSKLQNEYGVPIIVANRDGVGNYSRAFNEAFEKITHLGLRPDYVWMVSNIVFAPIDFTSLINAMYTNPEAAAIHPAMAGSDHIHQHPDGTARVKEAPFVEWTAPMVRFDVFDKFRLDESLPYYYMDLDWSHRVKQAGYKVAVDHGATVGHVYLRNKKSPHPISTIRAKLRDYWTPISQKHMHDKYGPDWKNLMNWKP